MVRAPDSLKLMLYIAEVLHEELLVAHLRRLLPGSLIGLLLVIQSRYMDADVVLMI